MESNRAFKIRLHPTKAQEDRINQFIGLFRFVYNWTIDLEKDNYRNTGKFTENWEVHREFKKFRNSLDENDPLKGMPLNTANRAINNAVDAYHWFFRKQSKYPKYKTKKTERRKNGLSFSVRGQRLKFHSDGVSIEGFGYGNHIKCDDYGVPKGENAKYYNCTVINDHGEYWLIVNARMIFPFEEEKSSEVIGIDVGLHTMAMLSNGTAYKSPNLSKLIKRHLRAQKRLQRDIYRRVNLARHTRSKYDDIPKTQNELKREDRSRKIARKISNIQNTYIHQVTREIVNTLPKAIILENLNISNMVARKNRKGRGKRFGDTIYRARLHTFRKTLQYKAEEKGIEVVLADRYFPSSQICSNCGSIHKTANREYVCPSCGMSMDRDLNAAINLRNYYSNRTW